MSIEFTAVVNCFNEEDFIRYSLESILAHVGEVIVVDNCSTDATVHTVNNLISIHPMGSKIKLFALDKPMQLADARNFALSQSRNEWVVKWDGDFCAYSNEDEVGQYCAPFSEVINHVIENKDKFDIFLLYSLNLCGDLYHFDNTRKFLGLSGDSFIGRRSCMAYEANDKYGDVGILNRPDGSKARLCYLNKPEINKMYFLHIYGVKDDTYLLYRRFLSEYQVWLTNQEYIEFWDWMRDFKKYNSENGIKYVRKQLIENLERHYLPLPCILKPVIDNPKYLVKYTNGQIVDRQVLR